MFLNTILFGIALHSPQFAAFISDDSGHCDWRERRDHHGHFGQWRHHGRAVANSRAWAPTCCKSGRGNAWGRALNRHQRSRTRMRMSIAQQIGGIAAVAPEARSGMTLVANGPQLVVQRDRAAPTPGCRPATGSWSRAARSRPKSCAPVRPCAYRLDLAANCTKTAPDVLGQHLRVKAFSCSIIGVLGSKGEGAFGNDQDDMVLIPPRPCSAGSRATPG